MSDMIHRQAKLSAEELGKIAKLEASIQHWAIQHSNLCIQAQTTLDQLKSMQVAHNQILEAAYKTAGIDPSTIQEIRISKDGTVDCTCLPPTVPTNGAPVAAPAPESAPEEPKNTAPTS